MLPFMLMEQVTDPGAPEPHGVKISLAILVAVRSDGWGFPSKYHRPSSLIIMPSMHMQGGIGLLSCCSQFAICNAKIAGRNQSVTHFFLGRL